MMMKNLKQLADAVPDRYKNFKVLNTNDHCMRMSVMEGLYDWHLHSNSDELFLVLEGELKVEFQSGSLFKLGPFDTLVVPKGMVHRTSSAQRTVTLCFELMNTSTAFIESLEDARAD